MYPQQKSKLELIDKMKSPSEEQLMAIEKLGRFVLHACPGSGKTYTVANKLVKRIQEWKSSYTGIADLSFTNVAHTQISEELIDLGMSPVPPFPHFLGTIDHFINSWIFLPFGHLVIGCPNRPSIVGLNSNEWNQEEHSMKWRNRECYSCNILDFSIDI